METKEDSATALSSATPTLPIDASSPASRSRRPNAQAANCVPWLQTGRAECGSAAPVHHFERVDVEIGPQIVPGRIADEVVNTCPASDTSRLFLR